MLQAEGKFYKNFKYTTFILVFNFLIISFFNLFGQFAVQIKCCYWFSHLKTFTVIADRLPLVTMSSYICPLEYDTKRLCGLQLTK